MKLIGCRQRALQSLGLDVQRLHVVTLKAALELFRSDEQRVTRAELPEAVRATQHTVPSLRTRRLRSVPLLPGATEWSLAMHASWAIDRAIGEALRRPRNHHCFHYPLLLHCSH